MTPPAPLRRLALLATFAVFGAVAAIAAIAPATDASLLLAKTATLEAVPLDPGAGLLPSPPSFVREERFRTGETVAALLARLGIAEADGQRLVRRREWRLLRPGTDIAAETSAAGDLVWIGFLAAGGLSVRIERVGNGLVGSEVPVRASVRAELKSATIRSSLFAATDAAGIPDAVAIQLADVFGGDIDFHRELRKGDRFTVLYEVHDLNGRVLRTGRVAAAEFVNQGKTYRAVRYADGYFAPDGRNLRKAFLRSPLELSRVSSGFGMRRHPFLQTWRQHQGVDYAAPTGTRVRAVSDGYVEFAGRAGGYGNHVVLRHQGQYSTLYAHLSGFARGVRKGARVAQGDTVGSVGQTGWATGPHLHYEFRIGGAARNPLTVALPAALPLPQHLMAPFLAHASPLVAQLDLLAHVQVAGTE